MTRQRIPDGVLTAAHERSRARQAHDWATADQLRGEIEAAGWTIVDRGTDFALSATTPPDVEESGRVRYGASTSVPSRLDEPAVGLATVVVVADTFHEDLDRTITALERTSPPGTSIVIVGDGGTIGDPDWAADQEVELVVTAAPLGHGATLNAGIRRATGPIVILLDPSVEPTGDIVTPLVRALDDPSVGVAGGWGITSRDLRAFDAAPAGDVDAIEGYAMAFRREDYAGRGPLDEKFRFYRNLDIWWSLVLRDEGEGTAARRAVSIDLPATRHEHRGWTSLPDDERTRQSKRNFYRIIDRFGWRRDLLIERGTGS
jgi:cysteinyl-tRNA synthetase